VVGDLGVGVAAVVFFSVLRHLALMSIMFTRLPATMETMSQLEQSISSAMTIEYKIPNEAQEVIDFWFAGDQTINYKTKWFPEGSSTLQANIDQEIYQRFHSLLKQALEGELATWQSTLLGNIALIIVLDQFSRHIFRHLQIPPGDEQRQQADGLALSIATSLHHNETLSLLSLSMAQYVFSLMPLRHSPSIDRLQYVLSRLEDKEHSQCKAEELLERFRKQTIRRLQHLEDRAKVCAAVLLETISACGVWCLTISLALSLSPLSLSLSLSLTLSLSLSLSSLL
jgi:uncharacterized protein (DUF924 family)